MMLHALSLLFMLSSAWGQDSPAPDRAAQDAPDPDASGDTLQPVDPYASLRALQGCGSVLPPLPEANVIAPPPLCARVSGDRRCVFPNRQQGLQRRPRQVIDPEDETPPPSPPYTLMYTTGVRHVFSWMKSLNTCRFQAGSAVPRPDDPLKGEFETDESFQEKLTAHNAAIEARAEDVIVAQAATEALLDEVTFVAVLPIESIGEYNAEAGCFFPGPRARVDLEEFKSRDTIYRTTGTVAERSRLVPRQGQSPVTIIGGDMAMPSTLKKAYFDDETPQEDLVLQSHPLCVSAEEGQVLLAQYERNSITDFGIHFEAVIQFQYTDERPVWMISGEFVNRNQPEMSEEEPETRLDRMLTTSPDMEEPPPPEVEEPPVYDLPMDEKGCSGCQAVPGAAGSSLLGFLLLGTLAILRRRQTA